MYYKTYIIHICIIIYIYKYLCITNIFYIRIIYILLLLDSQTTGNPDFLGLGLPLDAFFRNF